MGLKLLSISAGCTILNLVGLQYWKQMSLENYKPDGLIVEDLINSDNASHALELLLSLFSTPALVASFALNVFILIILCLKMIFFSELYSSEIRKLLERLINYIIYKGIFLPLVVPPTIFQIGLWSTWLGVVCFLKMFQALARDRLERLNASPSATPWTYFRVYSALLLVFSIDMLWYFTIPFLLDVWLEIHFDPKLKNKNVVGVIFWIVSATQATLEDYKMWLCFTIYSATSLSVSLLLFFEPSSIAFETLQAMVVHGFQLLEIWVHHSAGDIANFRLSKIFDISPAGSLWEWKGIVIRNLGFFLDMMTLLMAIAHYLHIWLLHGMAFHLVDAVLFLNIRALLSACVKRAKSFIKLQMALGTLHGALPDATHEELRAYDDECAICREPMAKAKKLSCNHLFHLACLRSWLDQGLTENYSCPTCRKPLFMDQPENGVSPRAAEISRDEQLAREMSAVLERPNLPGHNLPSGALLNQPQNLENGDRRTGIEPRWLGSDGAGPSGFGRVQMVMRQLAAVGETALEDAAWGLFPPNPSQAGTSRTGAPPPGPLRYPGGSGGLSMRSPSRALNDDTANILTMAETVREVLPHIPDDLIFQDLQRTNSVMVTVNNLLQT